MLQPYRTELRGHLLQEGPLDCPSPITTTHDGSVSIHSGLLGHTLGSQPSFHLPHRVVNAPPWSHSPQMNHVLTRDRGLLCGKTLRKRRQRDTVCAGLESPTGFPQPHPQRQDSKGVLTPSDEGKPDSPNSHPCPGPPGGTLLPTGSPRHRRVSGTPFK